MTGFPASMTTLVEQFSKMPGIGPKSAQRLAFYILKTSKEDSIAMASAIVKVKESVRSCSICNNLSDNDICEICKSPSRDKALICIVEEPDDVIIIEKVGHFHGIYHVLLGSLSPLDGIGPGDLKIRELEDRVKNEKFREVIIATDFNTEGEATALYLSRVLKDSGANITRVAYGIPVGGGLEYADQATIAKAFEGRREAK